MRESKSESAGAAEQMSQQMEGDRTVWHAPLPERLPEPTGWPAVLAFGASLAAWGIVTSWMISSVGVVLFGAGVAGWIARMRHERAE